MKQEGGLRSRGYSRKNSPERPLVSILTVVYNRRRYLERAIESVINQSYDNKEYIVIDGGSTDGSLDIIKKYDHAIDYWLSEPDQGMYYALNKAIELSAGEVIGIVHSDDFFLYDDVASKVADKVNEVDCDIYHGDALSIFEFADYCRFEKLISDHTHIIRTDASIIHPTSFIRKRVFEDLGLYDVRYKSASDYEFFVRCVKYNRTFCHLDFVISGIYNCGEDRVSNNCYSQLENYHFHKLHRTGNHNQYLVNYLNCITRRTLKRFLSDSQVAFLRSALDRLRRIKR